MRTFINVSLYKTLQVNLKIWITLFSSSFYFFPLLSIVRVYGHIRTNMIIHCLTPSSPFLGPLFQVQCHISQSQDTQNAWPSQSLCPSRYYILLWVQRGGEGVHPPSINNTKLHEQLAARFFLLHFKQKCSISILCCSVSNL